ncbi:fimbrillin family protein [Sphingobacterium kitahiroshimense]|uniref:Fimbrillin family protein n=1 Tax=Sphingobacterium kitahiroshimense TaxID=470446 RepID=A0ABV0BXL9_9SPHI
MKKTTHYLLIFLGISIFASCSKEGNNEAPVTGNETMLVVTVTGIKEVQSSTGLGLKNKAKLTANTQVSTIIQHNTFDVQVSMPDEIPQRQVVKQKGVSNKATLTAPQADVPASGITYRLYLFKKNDGGFVSSTALRFGTPGQLHVSRGTSYIWHALSYNNTEEIPNITGANSIVTLPENKDVLYASGEFTVPDNENAQVALPITFSHKFARLAVEINAMGLFADMTALTSGVKIGAGSAGTINNAALDIKTGTLVPTDINHNLSTLQNRDFIDIENGFQDRKLAYFYVPVMQGNENLKADVQINGLSIRLDNGTIRNFDENLLATPFTFQQEIALIEEGKSYYCLFNILESPITKNGLRWARQNLYVNENAHNPYRFLHTHQSTAVKSSWKPQELIGQGDPCLNVYPQGTWKMPSQEEVKSSIGPIGYINNFPFLNDSQSGLNYYEFAASGTASPYPDNTLRFNITPYRPLPEKNSNYWTLPFPYIGDGGDLETYIIMLNGDRLNSRSITISRFTQGGGIKYHNINYPAGFPIRCVRVS